MEWRKNLAVGLAFSGIAYLVASAYGFNRSSFTVFLYLYPVACLVSCLDYREIMDGVFDDLMYVRREEEIFLERALGDEKYRLKGTLEKVE